MMSDYNSTRLISEETKPFMNRKSYRSITPPISELAVSKSGTCSCTDVAHYHASGNSIVVERGWKLTISWIVALCLAAMFASLAWMTKSPSRNDVLLPSRGGKLPIMGYNTWNAYYCNINETVILEAANLMKKYGLVDAGYNWMNLDDCYAERNRSEDGDIVAHKTRFPSGMKYLTDQIHDLGMNAGIYSDSGWFTCQLYPGSYQNEVRDVKTFLDWGFDYLKYDNCAVPFDDIIRQGMVGKFQRIADAIAIVGLETRKPPMRLALCQWGRNQPWLWARNIGESWRSTDDIGPHWDAVASIINQGVNQFISWASDFYGHNDMDILEVGNGDLTYEESKTHFTAWALMKSPLLISMHLPDVTQETLEIVTNPEIIAINQDPVIGTAVTPFRWGINADWTNDYAHPAVFWSGRSQNGTVFMLINSLDYAADLSFNLTESPWIRAGRQYSVRDLWTHTDNGTSVREIYLHQVPAHGVVALLLKDAGNEPDGIWPPCQQIEWCMDQNGTRIDQ